MPGYKMTWKVEPLGIVDGRGIRPDVLCQMPLLEVAAQRIQIGNRDYPLGDVFEIEWEAGSALEVQGSVCWMHLGAEMAGGVMQIQGEAGDLAGRDMRGGHLVISGNAGHSLGAGMQGGKIHVSGAAGSRVGGPSPTSTQGMTDGEILVYGQAGPQAGFRMRRGLIVAQSCAEQPGYAMLAGTILVAQGPLEQPGIMAKRGTIISLDPEIEPTWLLNYSLDCVYEPVFIKVLLKHLAGYSIPEGAMHGKYRHYSGDRLSSGKAEILQRVGSEQSRV